MVVAEAQAKRRYGPADARRVVSRSDKVTRILAIARAWDRDYAARVSPGRLPPPRDGWARCFEAASERGFAPRTAVRLVG